MNAETIYEALVEIKANIDNKEKFNITSICNKYKVSAEYQAMLTQLEIIAREQEADKTVTYYWLVGKPTLRMAFVVLHKGREYKREWMRSKRVSNPETYNNDPKHPFNDEMRVYNRYKAVAIRHGFSGITPVADMINKLGKRKLMMEVENGTR